MSVKGHEYRRRRRDEFTRRKRLETERALAQDREVARVIDDLTPRKPIEVDPHAELAKKLGISRTEAKERNFGLLYGMSKKKLGSVVHAMPDFIGMDFAELELKTMATFPGMKWFKTNGTP